MKKKVMTILHSIAIIVVWLVTLTGCNKESPEIPSTVSDYDGNTYNAITIGNQVWIKENLKVTHLNNGESIPNVSDNTEWSNLTTAGLCYYDNSPINGATYGILYNWYAVSSEKLCPVGWHIATDSEWSALVDFIGGENIAGGKLKETGTLHWLVPNTGATNESGFSALPGGARWNTSTFDNLQNSGYWWSSTEQSPGFAWYRAINSSSSKIEKLYYNHKGGFSVRCIKN